MLTYTSVFAAGVDKTRSKNKGKKGNESVVIVDIEALEDQEAGTSVYAHI